MQLECEFFVKVRAQARATGRNVLLTLKYQGELPNRKVRDIWYEYVLHKKYVGPLREAAGFSPASRAL